MRLIMMTEYLKAEEDERGVCCLIDKMKTRLQEEKRGEDIDIVIPFRWSWKMQKEVKSKGNEKMKGKGKRKGDGKGREKGDSKGEGLGREE